MKKSIIGTLMLSTILLGSVTITHADSAYNSNGKINFSEKTDPVDPVNPTDPSKPDPDPIDPINPPNPPTHNPGPLSLDRVPALFDFGDQKISMKEETYTSQLTDGPQQEGEEPVTPLHVLQVTDNRSDMNGWSVKVFRTEFAKTDDPESKLDGSTLTIPAGIGRNAIAADPAQQDPNLISNGAVNIPVGDLTGAQTVVGVKNEVGAGKDTSAYSWESKDETLTVPGNTAKQGAYESTITWTLVADPVA